MRYEGSTYRSPQAQAEPLEICAFCVLKKIPCSDTFSRNDKTWASMDIGTHTARLLIAHDLGSSGILRPLARRRAYIRQPVGLAGKYFNRLFRGRR
jgi:hypothetical protein